jgi:thiosulfate/3-mercaptopyruvate sulfurtransferase
VSFGPLVAADWLMEHLQDEGLSLVDFLWYLDGRSGQTAYEAGHVPGAVFVDLEGRVTGRRSGAGRHPLPEREDFELAMRQAGLKRSDRVVVYDDQSGFVAGRLWWLLRYFGHEACAVLDGGLLAWKGGLETGNLQAERGDFVASLPRLEMQLEHEQVRQLGTETVLLDARSPERYRGEIEPADPRAGHIPGALNAPWRGNLDATGHFLSPEVLRQRFLGLGVRDGGDTAVYCGSGVSACHDLLALELAGLKGARLYPGSWSDWSSRPDAQVATGSNDGADRHQQE